MKVIDPGYINPKEFFADDFGIEHVESVKPFDDRASRIKLKLEPFLDNLMKNPDKDIHWPDRDKKIARFKKELWDIIDGQA